MPESSAKEVLAAPTDAHSELEEKFADPDQPELPRPVPEKLDATDWEHAIPPESDKTPPKNARRLTELVESAILLPEAAFKEMKCGIQLFV